MLNAQIFNISHSYETNFAMRKILETMISQASKIYRGKFIKALDEQFGKTCSYKLITLKNERKFFGEITEVDHYKHLAELLNNKIDLLEYTLLHNVGAPSYLEISKHLNDVDRFKDIQILSALEPWEIEVLAKKALSVEELRVFTISEVLASLAQIVVNEILSKLLGVVINQGAYINNAISRLALLVVNHSDNSEYKDLLNRLLVLNSRCGFLLSTSSLKICTSFRCNEETYHTPGNLMDLNDFYLGIMKE